MIASAIRTIIAPVLRECPPECGMVSITEVEVSREYSHVTVLVSALRSPESALRFLEGQCRRLQRELGVLHLRKIPMLRFRLDQRVERGDRIDALLRKADERNPDDTSGTSQE